MVRVTLDGTLKASAIILAGSLSLAALAHAWAATTRTTATPAGAWPGVFRENLWTGEVRYCAPMRDEPRVYCLSSQPRPLEGGRPVGGPAFTGGRKVDSAG